MYSTSNIFNDMNAEAVALMQRGNAKAAVKILRRALFGLRQDTNKPMAPQSASFIPMAAAQGVPIESVSVLHPYLDIKEASTENIFAFYPRAFTLSPHQEASQIAAVVLYNMALLHHAQGLLCKNKSGQVNVALLKQARDFYEAAQKIAFTNWAEPTFYNMYSLVLAIANNLGHIHSQTKSSLYDFSQMTTYLNYSVKLVSHPCVSSFVTEEDSEFFYLSIFTFMDSVSGLCLAPAA